MASNEESNKSITEQIRRAAKEKAEGRKEAKDKQKKMPLKPAAERDVFPSGDLEESMPKRLIQKKAKGGKVKSSASKRGDGIAQRGRTSGRMM